LHGTFMMLVGRVSHSIPFPCLLFVDFVNLLIQR
jgi:hypothetical protein